MEQIVQEDQRWPRNCVSPGTPCGDEYNKNVYRALSWVDSGVAAYLERDTAGKNEKKRIALAIELRAKYRKADLGAGIKERLQQLSQGKLPQEEKEMDENAEEAKD